MKNSTISNIKIVLWDYLQALVGNSVSLFIILCVCFLWIIALVDRPRSEFQGNDNEVPNCYIFLFLTFLFLVNKKKINGFI